MNNIQMCGDEGLPQSICLCIRWIICIYLLLYYSQWIGVKSPTRVALLLLLITDNTPNNNIAK